MCYNFFMKTGKKLLQLLIFSFNINGSEGQNVDYKHLFTSYEEEYTKLQDKSTMFEKAFENITNILYTESHVEEKFNQIVSILESLKLEKDKINQFSKKEEVQKIISSQITNQSQDNNEEKKLLYRKNKLISYNNIYNKLEIRIEKCEKIYENIINILHTESNSEEKSHQIFSTLKSLTLEQQSELYQESSHIKDIYTDCNLQ